jgi:ribosome biogenesis protein MAK21
MRALETLKGMAAKRGGAGAGKAEGVKALRAMVDWWVGGGGPGRKLRYANHYTRACSGIDVL